VVSTLYVKKTDYKSSTSQSEEQWLAVVHSTELLLLVLVLSEL